MTDAVRLIPAADSPAAPWGPHARAQVLAAHACAQATEGVLWRALSLDIHDGGACPVAQDLDCILMLVTGGPLHWTRIRSAQTTRLEPGSRLYFAAEDPCSTHAAGTPAHLFMLQLLRKQAHGCVDLRSHAQNLPMRAGDTLLHCASGTALLRLPAHLGGTRQLETGDTLHITLAREPAFVVPLEPGDAHSRLIDARVNTF
ncbi:HutD family protein [Castellaniella sp.]|uniref:HutD family protein n=1 Tax=Castellaniella sp. TaxID=1955812 RepID=UPI003560420A